MERRHCTTGVVIGGAEGAARASYLGFLRWRRLVPLADLVPNFFRCRDLSRFSVGLQGFPAAG